MPPPDSTTLHTAHPSLLQESHFLCCKQLLKIIQGSRPSLVLAIPDNLNSANNSWPPHALGNSPIAHSYTSNSKARQPWSKVFRSRISCVCSVVMHTNSRMCTGLLLSGFVSTAWHQSGPDNDLLRGAYTQVVLKLATQAELQCLLVSLSGPHAHPIAFIPNITHNPTHVGTRMRRFGGGWRPPVLGPRGVR